MKEGNIKGYIICLMVFYINTEILKSFRPEIGLLCLVKNLVAFPKIIL